MVSTFLQGGLGNYMFQISAAISIALDNNDDAIFSVSGSVLVHKHISEYLDNILRNIEFSDKPLNFNSRYNEPSFDFNNIPYQKDMILMGYFQSEKYFKHNRDVILNIFTPTYDELEHIHGKYGSLVSMDNSCSIHVRRGDYLRLSEHHPPCDMEYYTEAMSKMPKDTNYLVFSDDIEWCKRNFVGDGYTFIEGEHDVIDMHLMSLCKHNIIANSSFSWWGAWLNDNKKKIVVAPNKWFGPAKGNIKTDDIYSEKWIKI